jgi:hypothetical protein
MGALRIIDAAPQASTSPDGARTEEADAGTLRDGSAPVEETAGDEGTRMKRTVLGRVVVVPAVVILLTIALLFSATGCSQAPTAAELKAKCFANEAQMQTVMKVFAADTGGVNASFDTVVAKTNSVCPSGGKYSWDPATQIVTCSVHGHP